MRYTNIHTHTHTCSSTHRVDIYKTRHVTPFSVSQRARASVSVGARRQLSLSLYVPAGVPLSRSRKVPTTTTSAGRRQRSIKGADLKGRASETEGQQVGEGEFAREANEKLLCSAPAANCATSATCPSFRVNVI